jgi:Domain of unknown function (DUF4203)
VDFQAIVIGLLAILIGLAFTFMGFRLFLILLPVWGFFIGFYFGAEMVSVIFGTGFLADVTGFVVGFVAALIFAVASYLWYWLAVTILGGSVGYAVGVGLIGFLGISNNFINVVIGLLFAIVFAVAAIWLRLPKYLAIAFTSVGGAFAAVAGLAILFGKLDTTALGHTGTTIGAIKDLNWLWLAAAIVLTVIGIWYQTRSTALTEVVAYDSYRNPGTPAPV